MSRRNNDYRSFYELIILIITIIGVVIKFLIEVNKHGLWKECIFSVSSVFLLNYGLHQLWMQETIPFKVFGWSCLISFIAFCVYWSGLFNNSPYGQFSKGSLKQNSASWSEQAWWWSLDGWQFEQEVAKLFIIQGFRATVTKGSGDGGVDIIIKKDGYRGIIQCKHHRNPVPPEPIRALWGCKDDFGADEVILIASSGITQAGADFVSNKPNFRVLTLYDIIRMSYLTQQGEPQLAQVKESNEEPKVLSNEQNVMPPATQQPLQQNAQIFEQKRPKYGRNIDI